MITRTRSLALCIGSAALFGACTSNNSPAPTPENAVLATEHDKDKDKGQCDGDDSSVIAEGRKIFRYDTFGSEHFFGDVLRLHEAIATVSPKTALAVGLKVDMDALPASLVDAFKKGKVDLDDPKNTVALLGLNAVLGVKGFVSNGVLTSIGIECAFCHSTVDNAFAPGIGHRLDGWPNRDLDVGTIVSLAPNLQPFADLLSVDVATVKAVLTSWGPGKYDAELNQDGKAFRPDGKSAATVIPAAFGLAGVNLHTYNGWGSVPYWNAYVAVTQMRGQGTFFDPRLNDAVKYPLVAKTGFSNVRFTPDLVTSKLPALQAYQLSIAAPTPPQGSFDWNAAKRGRIVFEGKGKCASCHVAPLFTEPGWNMHTGEEIGIDDFQAARSPDGKYYRTTPLKGLFTRLKPGLYHDGRFATLGAVVDHYQTTLALGLSGQEQTDLVEYLKSL